MAWNSEIKRLNCLRCLEYFNAASYAPCAMPTDSAAMDMRPPSRMRRLSMNPSPSLPQSWEFGRRQLVQITSPVGEQRIPSLFSFLPVRKPGVPFSMMNAEIPWEEPARSVTAITTSTSATCALVVNVLLPLSTQQSPSRTAEVRVWPASEPDSGSVSDHAPIHSPEASLGM